MSAPLTMAAFLASRGGPILRGSSLPVRFQAYLRAQPRPARHPYRTPGPIRFVDRLRNPNNVILRPGQAVPSLGTRIEDGVILSGLQTGASAVPYVGPVLAALAPLAVKPIEAVISAIGDVLGIGNPDYAAMQAAGRAQLQDPLYAARFALISERAQTAAGRSRL